jgi:lipid-binding SYLF domain-containing protein
VTGTQHVHDEDGDDIRESRVNLPRKALSEVVIKISEQHKLVQKKEGVKMRKSKVFTGVIAVAVILSFTAFALPSWGATKEEINKEKADIRKMSKETLNRLYKLQPSAKDAVSKAAGYAVFSNFGMKIFVAGSGSGKGVAMNNKANKETFMKMIEAQAGLGFGVKKFRLVWVFENETDLKSFIDSGYELGAQTSIAAKTGSQGASFTGAMSVKPGVWLYQLTDDGLALELTAKGTKYYKYDDLNK